MDSPLLMVELPKWATSRIPPTTELPADDTAPVAVDIIDDMAPRRLASTSDESARKAMRTGKISFIS